MVNFDIDKDNLDHFYLSTFILRYVSWRKIFNPHYVEFKLTHSSV